MIIEVATVKIKPGSEAAFETAVDEATKVFSRAKGCLGLHLQRCIEVADEYEVVIRWETLENHTIDFREGPLFLEWRALITPHFVSPPTVRHYEIALKRSDFSEQNVSRSE